MKKKRQKSDLKNIMFKWKVSRLGSKKDRSKQKLNNEVDENEENMYGKNNNNNKDR